MITRIAAVVGLALVVVAAAACGGTQKSAAPPSSAAKPKPAAKAKARTTAAPPADTLHCVDVPRAVTRFILRGVVLDGARLARVEAVESSRAPGYYFISGVVSGGGASPNSLATFATDGLTGVRRVYAVDSFAALISKYGAAQQIDPDLTINASAAYASRVCAGGPHASHGTPAPQSGIGLAPASG
jgi:hypothetical protein